MKASLADQNARFAEAMTRVSGSYGAPPKAVPAPVAAADEIALGIDERGAAIRLSLARLLSGRLLIQGLSGAGKSWTLRRLVEQGAPLIQTIVIDPEGEFRTLAEELRFLYVEGHRLDGAALAALASRAREHRASLVLDLAQLDREDQMKAFAAFVHALVQAAREHWHPTLVAVDEAHLFAPFGGHVDGAALALLDRWGALEIAGDVVRLERSMRPAPTAPAPAEAAPAPAPAKRCSPYRAIRRLRAIGFAVERRRRR